MPRLSILIPVLGSVGDLETTLVSVLEKRPADCEIIVLLAAPYADPYALEGEVRFVTVDAGGGLVAMLNRGLAQSSGEVVHFLASGLEVNDGWADCALGHFQDPLVGSVAPVLVDSSEERLIAAGVRYSARYGRVVRRPQHSGDLTLEGLTGPLIDAAFYRRAAIELADGLSPAVGDDLADVDLGLTLHFVGYRAVVEPQSRVIGPAAVLRQAKPGFQAALQAETLFWRGASVVGWWRSLAAHPVGLLKEFVSTLPRPRAFSALLGRMCGVCRMHQHGSHARWLYDVKRAAEAILDDSHKEQLRFDAPHAHQGLAPAEMTAERVST